MLADDFRPYNFSQIVQIFDLRVQVRTKNFTFASVKKWTNLKAVFLAHI